MKLYLSVFALLLVFNVNAQKLKITKDMAYVDGKEYIKIGKCGALRPDCSLYLPNGKEIIFITRKEDPNDTRFIYMKVVFLGTNKYIELRKTIKALIELLYENNAIAETGELNKESIDILVEKYGNSITGDRKN